VDVGLRVSPGLGLEADRDDRLPAGIERARLPRAMRSDPMTTRALHDRHNVHRQQRVLLATGGGWQCRACAQFIQESHRLDSTGYSAWAAISSSICSIDSLEHLASCEGGQDDLKVHEPFSRCRYH